MKFWVKIIIAVCVVLVIGFAVWAFFFREKDEVQAYSRTSELIDYKESLGIEEKLIDLSQMDYLNGDRENVIDSTSTFGKEIYRLRAAICSQDKIVGSSSDGVSYTYASCLITDEMVDDIIAYYLPYTKANKVNNKSLKNLKSKISDYISSLKDLNVTIDELITFQNSIEGNNSEMEALKGRYGTLQQKYRKTLGNSSQLIISLMEYIDISVYSDKMIIETTSALYDAFARSLNVYASVDSNLEIDYAHDLHVIMLKIEDVRNGTSIYSEKYPEYKFLSSYNMLFNNYKDTLNHVYSTKNLEKKQMAAGTHLDKVLEKAQSSVITILNVLGFVGV